MRTHVELLQVAPFCIVQVNYTVPNHTVGWVPKELCQNISYRENTKYWWEERKLMGTKPGTDLLPGDALWIYGCYINGPAFLPTG